MVKRILISVMLVSCCFIAFPQSSNALREYLQQHQYGITFNKDSSLNFDNKIQEAIKNKVLNKKLFVFGEGGSHFLELNHKMLQGLKAMFIKSNNLNIFFVEADRAYGINVNAYLNGTYRNDELPFYKAYKNDFEALKKLYDENNKFSYIGLDFERPKGFYMALSNISKQLDVSLISKIYTFAPYITDTTYLSYHLKDFFKYYKNIREQFFKDSSSLKPLLGQQFSDFSYLLTNFNTSLPNEDRDKPMARNLLDAVAIFQDNRLNFLDCGGFHSRPNIRGSLVNILSKSDELQNKIVVMNLYCENCITSVEAVSNWTLPFMKGDVLASFQISAKSDIVLFDLSALPEKYDYIKAYGDFILFARNQD